MKFRKKPVVVEAFQYPECGWFEVPLWFEKLEGKWRLGTRCLYIDTPEGTMAAQPGDWIIKGIKGEIYPCKPDIFEATYEAVE